VTLSRKSTDEPTGSIRNAWHRKTAVRNQRRCEGSGASVVRVDRVAPQSDLQTIASPIPVAVRHQRIHPEPRDLLTVIDAVAIGICTTWVRPEFELVAVTDAVAIRVAKRIGRIGWIEVVLKLPGVWRAVTIAVELPVDVDENARYLTNTHYGNPCEARAVRHDFPGGRHRGDHRSRGNEVEGTRWNQRFGAAQKLP
jgi:hypothetical protein